MTIYVVSIMTRDAELGFGFVDRRAFTTYSAAKQWIKDYMIESDTTIVERSEIITVTLER